MRIHVWTALEFHHMKHVHLCVDASYYRLIASKFPLHMHPRSDMARAWCAGVAGNVPAQQPLASTFDRGSGGVEFMGKKWGDDIVAVADDLAPLGFTAEIRLLRCSLERIQ